MYKKGFGKFEGFQATNFGRTLFVSFWILPLVLGVDPIVEGVGKKDKWK